MRRPSSEVPRQIRQCVDTYTGATFYIHNENSRHTMQPKRKGPDAKRRSSSTTEVEAAAKVAAAMHKVDPTCIFHVDHLAAIAMQDGGGASNSGDGSSGSGGGSAHRPSQRYSLLSQASMNPEELLQESDNMVSSYNASCPLSATHCNLPQLLGRLHMLSQHAGWRVVSFIVHRSFFFYVMKRVIQAKHILEKWVPPPITRPGIMKTGGSKGSAPGTDQKNRKARAERRRNLLDTLEGDPAPPFPLDRFSDVAPYTDSPYTHAGPLGAEGSNRFMVECNGYNAGLFLPLNIEPHFASVMLYDAKKQVRISENFHFDLNDEATMAMLPEARLPPSATLKQAIFTVSQDIKDVFIVFRFEKVLEDPTKAFEAYSKATDEDGVEGASEKSRKMHAKLVDNAQAICQRRGEFRMPFAWAAIPLGDPVAYTGGPNSPTADIKLYQQSYSLSDDDLGPFIADLGNKEQDWTTMKKAKPIPDAWFKFRARQLAEDAKVPYCLTSTLYRAKPYLPAAGAGEGGHEPEPSLEVQEFPSEGLVEPNRTYRHNLYVYIKSADFKSTSNRNIAVRVHFLDASATAGTTSGTYSPDQQLGMPTLYSHTSCELTSSITTAVSYHNKSPTFYEEIKVLLPAQMTPDTHLLFSFFHVPCKDAKGSKADRDIKPFGYAFFPLIQHHRLQTGSIQLPVAVELPVGYLERGTKIKWIDGEKKIFNVDVKLDSTVLSDDLYVQGFMLGVDKCLHSNVGSAVGAGDHIPIHNLRKPAVPPEALLEFLPTIMNQLLAILVHHPCQVQRTGPQPARTGPGPATASLEEPTAIAKEAFGSLCHVIETVSSFHRGAKSGGRSRDLLVYIKYMFHIHGPTGKAVPAAGAGNLFEELTFWVNEGLTYDKAPTADAKNIFHVCASHTWVFFELILKSAAEYIVLNNMGDLARKKQLPERFTAALHKLVVSLVKALTEDRILPKERAIKLNSDVSFFLRDCLTYFDRTAGFKLIHETLQLLTAPSRGVGKSLLSHIPFEALTSFRLDMLEVLASHPQFVPLNLPDKPGKDSAHAPVLALGATFLKQHYLVGLLLCEVSSALHSPKAEVRLHAISLIRTVLSRHDHDPRYKDKRQQEVVYGLYFPLLSVILRYMPIYAAFDHGDPRQQRPSASPQADAVELSEEEGTQLLVIFMHVLSKVNVATLRQWWTMPTMVPKEQRQLMRLLELCGKAVAYTGSSGAKKITEVKDKLGTLAAFYTGGKTGGARDSLSSSKAREKSGLRWSKARPDSEAGSGGGGGGGGTATGSGGAPLVRRPPRGSLLSSAASSGARAASIASVSTIVPAEYAETGAGGSFRYVVESTGGLAVAVPDSTDSLEAESLATMGYRATEGSMIILDCFEAFTEDLKETMRDKPSATSDGETLMATAFAVIDVLLSNHQSAWTIRFLFSALQTFVNKFHDAIFTGSTTMCKTLCKHVLEYCSFGDYEDNILPPQGKRWYKSRELASAFMYMLIRENHRHGLNNKRTTGIARVQAQTMITMSEVVEENKDSADDIRRSLGTIVQHSKLDVVAKKTKLPTLVTQLAENLTRIMLNTLQIRKYTEFGVDTRIDLQYRIAKGYEGSPTLRQVWLQNLAKTNKEDKRFAEAAFCQIHIAASIVNCLCDQLDPLAGFEKGAAAFVDLSANVENDEGKTDAHDAYDADTFEEGKVLALLKTAADNFSEAKMFEFQISALKLGIPYFEKRRDAQQLARTHADISNAYVNVIKASAGPKKRNEGCFGSYFRVGIFSKLVPTRVFVAKYPPYTPLAAVLDKMQNELRKTMELEDPTKQLSIEVAPHPNDINPDTVPEGVLQLQVTAVEPHGKDANAPFFERFTRIKEFVFDTPITDGGKAHGTGVKDQKLRRTVIKTERGLSFPYMRSRIDVKMSDVTHTVLEPIEIAIEKVRDKTIILAGILLQSPVDIKLLHLHLGGCVQAAVNGGPALYAEAFLGDGSEYLAAVTTAVQKKRAKELRREFGKLVVKCEEAITVNRDMMTDQSQRGLHEQYELGLEGLKVIDKRLKESAAASRSSAFATRPKQSEVESSA